MYAACALLLLFVEEAEAVADDADAAQLRSRDFVWMPLKGL